MATWEPAQLEFVERRAEVPESLIPSTFGSSPASLERSLTFTTEEDAKSAQAAAATAAVEFGWAKQMDGVYSKTLNDGLSGVLRIRHDDSVLQINLSAG